ncbi:MAG TPA: hypothetical protein VFQ53_21400 [Kofleriaceae bacterium]|nr:hypothetical protein [Kofleriaceae bacterium]
MGEIKDKIKGKLKQTEGRLTGDRVRETQGTVEKKKGDLEGLGNRVKNRVKAEVNGARARSAARSRRRTP